LIHNLNQNTDIRQPEYQVAGYPEDQDFGQISRFLPPDNLHDLTIACPQVL